MMINSNTQDIQFMRRALELARHAESCGEVPVGAVLVLDEKIIAEGWNQPICTNDPTAHAEIVALRAGAKSVQNYRLVDTTLYVTLEPCAMCFGAMVHARIKRLVFGAYDLKSSDACNHDIDLHGGVLEQESSDLLRSFFQVRR